MLPSNRRKIREVDVEVVTSGDDGAIDPDAVSGHSGAANGRDQETSAEDRSATDRDRLLGSLLALGSRRSRAKDAVELEPPIEPEAVADVPEEVEGPVVAAEAAPAEEAMVETPSVEPVAGTAAETPEAAETPMSTEPSRVEEPIQRSPAPPAPIPSAKARVVWTASPATPVSRGHTLKLTKPAPTETPQGASVRPKPVAKPPVEKPQAGATPPAAAKAPERVQKPLPPAPPPPSDEPVHEAAVPPAPPAEQTCDILFWRGYRKAAFYGRTFDETGEPVAVAESPFFRSQGNGVPEPTEAAKAAYETLRSQLIALGWEPVAAGDDWFDEKFRLTAAAEPEQA